MFETAVTQVNKWRIIVRFFLAAHALQYLVMPKILHLMQSSWKWRARHYHYTETNCILWWICYCSLFLSMVGIKIFFYFTINIPPWVHHRAVLLYTWSVYWDCKCGYTCHNFQSDGIILKTLKKSLFKLTTISIRHKNFKFKNVLRYYYLQLILYLFYSL